MCLAFYIKLFPSFPPKLYNKKISHITSAKKKKANRLTYFKSRLKEPIRRPTHSSYKRGPNESQRRL